MPYWGLPSSTMKCVFLISLWLEGCLVRVLLYRFMLFVIFNMEGAGCIGQGNMEFKKFDLGRLIGLLMCHSQHRKSRANENEMISAFVKL